MPVLYLAFETNALGNCAGQGRRTAQRPFENDMTGALAPYGMVCGPACVGWAHNGTFSTKELTNEEDDFVCTLGCFSRRF